MELVKFLSNVLVGIASVQLMLSKYYSAVAQYMSAHCHEMAFNEYLPWNCLRFAKLGSHMTTISNLCSIAHTPTQRIDYVTHLLRRYQAAGS